MTLTKSDITYWLNSWEDDFKQQLKSIKPDYPYLMKELCLTQAYTEYRSKLSVLCFTTGNISKDTFDALTESAMLMKHKVSRRFLGIEEDE